MEQKTWLSIFTGNEPYQAIHAWAVGALGENAAGIQADSGKLDDLDRLLAEIKEKKGRLDVWSDEGCGSELRAQPSMVV
jgi:hypothetical protein